jgi:diguanylate cyclase (GGDEF)-like protein
MLIHEKNIIKVITFGPLIFIPSVVLMFMLLIIKTHNYNYEKTIENLQHDIKEHQEISIRSRVKSIVDLIEYQQSITNNNLKARVKKRVHNAYKIASSIYKENKKEKSAAEIKRNIVQTLRPLIWNNGESFIWILNYRGVFQLAPFYLKHLEQTSILELTDSNGRKIIKDEIAICKSKGEGFLWDEFTKPNTNSTKGYKQLAFVKAFGHYDWYFGSAEYLDTALKKTDAELINTIDKINDVESGYIFIINTSGEVLLNPALPKNKSINILTSKDKFISEVSHKIFGALKDKNEAFVKYRWKNESTKKEDTKYAYVQRVKNSDWIVGSGFYDSDIQEVAKESTQQLYQTYQLGFKRIMYMTVFLIIASLVISYFISKYVDKIYKNYRKDLFKKTDELQMLNETLEQKVQERTRELEITTKKLETLATTDSLTQLHNRYSIMSILDSEMQRSKRYGDPLSVSMFDIDHFKDVNDTYGHDVGDDVLHTIGEIVQHTLRSVDIIGRYGGEEFLIIMPNTPFKDAKQINERVRQDIEKHDFDKVGKVTISIGMITYNKEENIDQLFKRLDKLLYYSKQNGRNRLSF